MMNLAPLKYILISFLAVLIIIGSSGIIIGRMMCMQSGNVVYNLGPSDKCCKDDAGSTTIGSSCCDLSTANLKVDKFSGSQKVSPPAKEVNSLISPFMVPSFTYEKTNNNNRTVGETSPPPLLQQPLFLIFSFLRL
jgi:hypothetical protein